MSAVAGRRPALARRLARPVPFLLTVTAVQAIWWVANLDRLRGPLVLLWLATPIAAVVATAAWWRIVRGAGWPRPTRQFWLAVGVTTTLVGLGGLVQMADALAGRLSPDTRMSPGMLAFDGAAVIVVLVAVLRLPLARSTTGDRIRVALDAAAVMLAASAFLWHFRLEPQLLAGSRDLTVVLAGAVSLILSLVAVLAVAKVLLVGKASVDQRALWLAGLGMLVGSLGGIPDQLLAGRPHLAITQVVVPGALALGVAAVERQARAGRRTTAPVSALVPRQASLLPYAAIAAVGGLLLIVTWLPGPGNDGVVALAAVAITAIVVARQLTVLRDNAHLLQRLDHGATHDALTQLPNRALLHARLRATLGAADPERMVSIVQVDLDDFRQVNDTLGHSVGDALLVEVAARLAEGVRPVDTAARLGSDEFALLLDGLAGADADRVARSVVAALSRPVVVEGQELLVRASAGVADARAGDDPAEVLRRADVAMTAAKRDGLGWARWHRAMGTGTPEGARLGAELRTAIADDQLMLLYQPIVDLDGRRLTAVEALVRWVHPARGVISPADFIPVAERTGLVVPLGRWVLREACRQIAAWDRRLGEDAPAVVHVNVSARQLRESGFAGEVAAALADHGVRPERLTLEITETTMVGLGASTVNLVTLRRMGVRISLDDFGTGQSTLSLLQDFPVDELKLDRSFTQGGQDDSPTTMAAAVIQLARVLGLHVVAEGVETPEQARMLAALGYESAQGYYYARPMPPDDLGDLVLSARRDDAVAPGGGTP